MNSPSIESIVEAVLLTPHKTVISYASEAVSWVDHFVDFPAMLDSEDRFIYLHLKWSNVILIYLFGSFICIFIAFQSVSRNADLSPSMFKNRTIEGLTSYEVFPNGTKYYDYYDVEENLEKRYIFGAWFDEVLAGKTMYVFGGTHFNFCWMRSIPAIQSFPSLFRASQLRALVQVPLRANVLLTLSIRFCQSLFIGFATCYLNPSLLNHFTFAVFVSNEMLHGTCLFLLSDYLVTPDKEYIYLVGYILLTAHLTFVIKMLFSVWHKGNHWSTCLRILFASLVLFGWPIIEHNIYEYTSDPVCDSLTEFWRTVPEYVAVILLFGASILDASECKMYEIVETANEIEMEAARELNIVEKRKSVTNSPVSTKHAHMSQVYAYSPDAYYSTQFQPYSPRHVSSSFY